MIITEIIDILKPKEINYFQERNAHIMINSDQNPEFLNSFLDYSITILNKSVNSVKEYNYDLNMFFKYMKIHFKLTKETDFKKIYKD